VVAPGSAVITAHHGALTASTAITVAAPDVRVVSITPAVSTITAGVPFNALVVVENAGGSAAAAAPIALRVLDAASGAVLRDTLIAGLPLAGGASLSVPVTQVLPTTIAWPDSVRFELVLNADHSIPDSDAANDALSSVNLRVLFPVAAVALSSHARTFTSIGDADTLHVILSDIHERALGGRTVTYASRDGAVASVSAAGVVTAAATGDTWVVATSEGVSDSMHVHVAQAVASVIVSPSSMTFYTIGRAASATAVASDARGHVVSGATTAWSSADTEVATVDAAGTVTALQTGSTTVTANVNGVTATLGVTVTQTAAAIVASAPDGIHLAGDTVALSAAVSDSSGAVIASPPIVWTSSRAGVASVDANGVVIGLAPDTVTITATTGGVSSVVHMTFAVGGPVLILADADLDFSGVVGEALAEEAAVIVRDARGNPVPNASVEWLATDQAADTTTTNASGRATFAWTLGHHAGHQRLRARAVLLADTVVFAANARAGAPARGSKNRGGLSATVSETLSDEVEVQLFDQYDNPVPDRTITWHVVGGPGRRSRLANGDTVQVTTTDADGKSVLSWDGFDTHVGVHQLRASVDGTPINIDIEKQTQHGPARHGSRRGGGATATVSQTLSDTIQIEVTDEFENPVDNAVITWTIQGGNSHLPNGLASYNTTTDSLGRGILLWDGFDTHVGLHRLRASIDGTDINIDIEKQTRHAAPSRGSKRSGGLTATVSTSLTDTVEVEVTDEFENPVDGVVVTWTKQGGNNHLPNGEASYNTTTDSAGRARLVWDGFDTHVGVHQLRASVDGTPISIEIEKTTKPARLQHLHLSQDSVVLTSIDEEFEFTAAPTDEFGNQITPDSITWDAALPDTAEVLNRGRGKVKAHGNGRTVVHTVATYEGVQVADSVVVIVAQEATEGHIDISGPSWLFLTVDTVYVASGVDAKGHTITRWRWSIVDDVDPAHELKGRADILDTRRSDPGAVTLRGVSPGWVVLQVADPKGSVKRIPILVAEIPR
jgi:adhesin/invasin